LTEALAKAQEVCICKVLLSISCLGCIESFVSSFPQTATDLNEHIRQIENESRIFEIINMFPNDDLVSYLNLSA
jgi:hypothetical protein